MKLNHNAHDAVKMHYEKIQQKDKRPNILILMTDQQRFDTIHRLGYPHMHTPNLDRLTEEGTSYINAYTPTPICLAARQNFLTGLSAKDHGMPDNDFTARTPHDILTFPRIFADADYDTTAIGKMHFQPMRAHHGYNRLKLMEEVPEHREDDDYLLYLQENGHGDIQNIHGVRNLLYMLPQRSIVPDEYHGTKWVADEGIKVIKENNGKRPFLLYLSWIAPHPPFNCPEKYADYYTNADIPKPYISTTPLNDIAPENAHLGDLPNDDYIKRMREVYYGLISHVDEHVGRVIASLEEIGQLDNTLIIFTSDHGELLGDYGLYQKWLPYGSSSRIPFIVRYPQRFKKDFIAEEFVDLNDIYPTLLDIAGIKYYGKHELAGESIASPPQKKDRDYQYVSYSASNRRWCSVTSHEYRYNYFYGGGKEELFDLINDPYETTNILLTDQASKYETPRITLRKKLVEYEKDYWKPKYIKDNDFVAFEPFIARPTRNIARPQYPRNTILPDQEKITNDFHNEVLQAISKEKNVKIEELDYKSWQNSFGLSEELVQELIIKDKKNKN